MGASTRLSSSPLPLLQLTPSVPATTDHTIERSFKVRTPSRRQSSGSKSQTILSYMQAIEGIENLRGQQFDSQSARSSDDVVQYLKNLQVVKNDGSIKGINDCRFKLKQNINI
ncbi:hypothetical protein AAMO2058_001151900 [Amorphochlora amoebiformis]